jgi:ABC-type branched-subunit amino acid transport system ATPase component
LTVPPDRVRSDRLLVIQVIAMKTPLLPCASAACCAVAFCVLLTRPSPAEEFEQHPPHEHGKVTINAALDGSQLVIELDSPAVNVLLPLQFSSARRQRLADLAPGSEVLRLLGALGLSAEGLLERPVTQLSIGQQQLVAAARALIGRPDIQIVSTQDLGLKTS